jgi:CRISPR-associated protein (TIGR02710 family)
MTPESRGKGGLGIVLNGQERCLLSENPWNRVAYFESRAALSLFNRGQYGNAAALLGNIHSRVTESMTKRVFGVLKEVFQGYYEWDVFNHRGAVLLLNKHKADMQDLAQTHQPALPDFKSFAEQTAELAEILNNIKPGELSSSLVHDLLANAWRRARLEHKYEDACARCYAVLEKAAKHALLCGYGIKSNAAAPGQIPEELRADFVKRGSFRFERKDGTTEDRLRFGLCDAYRLLNVLGDNLGRRYYAREKELTSHLGARNMSILAHGETPADEKAFDLLFNDALYLLKIEESMLTRFPCFNGVE